MKKLEDLPRKNIFETPEGYFDQLPSVIQSRILLDKKKAFHLTWGLALRYAVPALILGVMGIFWFNTHQPAANIEDELQALNADQLSLFLNDTDLSTEDLIETVAWSEGDVQDLEAEVYSTLDVTGPELESILGEYGAEL